MAFDFFLILFGLNVQIIYMFREEWLFGGKSITVIFFLNLCLFFLVLIQSNTNFLSANNESMLKVPVLSTFIFYLFHQTFRYFFKRNPINTFWSNSNKPIQDVIFNILFWIIGIGIPVLLFT